MTNRAALYRHRIARFGDGHQLQPPDTPYCCRRDCRCRRHPPSRCRRPLHSREASENSRLRPDPLRDARSRLDFHDISDCSLKKQAPLHRRRVEASFYRFGKGCLCGAAFFPEHDSEQRHTADCNHRTCRRLGDGRSLHDADIVQSNVVGA
jgi:hypothetical protein